MINVNNSSPILGLGLDEGHSAADIDRDFRTLLDDTLLGLATYIQGTLTVDRSDRLTPCDVIAFQTNPFSLAYGAAGPALFLWKVTGTVPAPVIAWLLRSNKSFSALPPGLYTGLAGLAWTLAEVGLHEDAQRVLKASFDSPLAFMSPSIFEGAAGVGMTAISFFRRTGNPEYLAQAVRCGEHLLRTAVSSPAGVYWTTSRDEAPRLGYAYGGSGIGLFFLYLWKLTGDAAYKKVACAGLEFDVASAKEDGNTLVWGATTTDIGHRPYWLRGGAGIVSTLIRFSTMLGDERYLALARRGAGACAAFFSVSPALFEGLAAMGNTMIDMYIATGDSAYMVEAIRKAEQILFFVIKRPEGTAFPGRFLFRISNDYGTGGAGIGCFLHRLLHLTKSDLHDM